MNADALLEVVGLWVEADGRLGWPFSSFTLGMIERTATPASVRAHREIGQTYMDAAVVNCAAAVGCCC